MSVYFIQSVIGGPIKIGAAVDVSRRLTALQTGCPFRLVVLATMPGDLIVEQRLHIEFSSSIEHGEWFRPSADLCALIEQLGGSALPLSTWQPTESAQSEPVEPTTIGARVRALRVAYRLSQSALAIRAGVTRSEVVKIEGDHNKATSYRVRAGLAKAFGIGLLEFDAFLDGRTTLEHAIAHRPTTEEV